MYVCHTFLRLCVRVTQTWICRERKRDIHSVLNLVRFSLFTLDRPTSEKGKEELLDRFKLRLVRGRHQSSLSTFYPLFLFFFTTISMNLLYILQTKRLRHSRERKTYPAILKIRPRISIPAFFFFFYLCYTGKLIFLQVSLVYI